MDQFISFFQDFSSFEAPGPGDCVLWYKSITFDLFLQFKRGLFSKLKILYSIFLKDVL